MIPSSWDNSNMGGFENTFRYQGHYMSLYHYNTPPSINEMDGILYLLRAESTVAEIKEHIKNLDHKNIFLFPHPFCVHGRPDGWQEEPLGAMIKELREYANSVSNVMVVENTLLVDVIDSFKFIMCAPPTSTLIEAIVRGKIYRSEKRIVATGTFNGLLSHYGIPNSVSPKVADFEKPDNNIINGFVIGKSNQENEILNCINFIKNWRT